MEKKLILVIIIVSLLVNMLMSAFYIQKANSWKPLSEDHPLSSNVDQIKANPQFFNKRKVKLQGRLTALFQEGKPPVYSLYTGNDRMSLFLKEGIVVESRYLGEKVEVEGYVSINSDGILTQVTSIFSHSTASISGVQQTALIGIKFHDEPIAFHENELQEYFTTLLFTGDQSLNSYYKEVSYDAVSFAGTIYGWYTLPNNWDDYVDETSDDLHVDQPYWLIQDAISLADNDVNFKNFQRVIIVYVCMMNPDFRAYAYTSYLFNTNDDILPIPISVTAIPETEPLSVFAHEMGHLFGLPDLYKDNSPDLVGPWDLMASGRHGPSHLTSWSKIKLAWISESQVIDLNPGQSIQQGLDALATPTPTTGFYAIKIPLTGASYYLIEFRQRVGYDSSLHDEGLLVLLIDDGKDGYGSVTVKFDDSRYPDKWLWYAAYETSEVYQNTSASVVVTALSTSTSPAIVRVGDVQTATSISIPNSVIPESITSLSVNVEDIYINNPVPGGSVSLVASGGKFPPGASSIILYVSGGQASTTWTAPQTEGTHTITASYSGHLSFQPSQGATSVTVSFVSGLDVEISLSSSFVYQGTGITITATVSSQGTLFDEAAVMATITRPDSTQEPITLDWAHATGKYSGTYTNTNLLGTYQVLVTASKTGYRSGFGSTTFSVQPAPPPAEDIYYILDWTVELPDGGIYPYPFDPLQGQDGNWYAVEVTPHMTGVIVTVKRNGGDAFSESLGEGDLRYYYDGNLMVYIYGYGYIGPAYHSFLEIWYGPKKSGVNFSPKSQSVTLGGYGDYSIGNVPTDWHVVYVIDDPGSWSTFPGIDWDAIQTEPYKLYYFYDTSNLPSTFTLRMTPPPGTPGGTYGFKFVIFQIPGSSFTQTPVSGYFFRSLTINVITPPPSMSTSISSWNPPEPMVGETTQATITIAETEGLANVINVFLEASDLVEPEGASISGSYFSFDKNNFDVPAGNSENVLVTLTIPSSAVPSTYTGSISVITQNAGTSTLNVALSIKPISVTTTTVISATPTTLSILEHSSITVNVKDVSNDMVPGGNVILMSSGRTFENGESTIMLTLVSGIISTAWTPSFTGNYTITALYIECEIGSIKYESSSSTQTLTVNKASTTLTTSLSSTRITYGSNVTITASLSPPMQGKSIQIEFGFDDTSWNILSSGITNSTGQYAYTWTPDTGTYYLRSTWYGNNNYNGASSPSRACIVALAGDANFDHIVDIFDIGYVSAHWYPGPPVGPLGYDVYADINNDLAVDILDIGTVSSHWGESW